jgi:phosphate transport system substrate-binding protein
MKFDKVAIALVVSALLFGSAIGCKPADPEKVVLTGSSTIAPMVAELGKKFEAVHPGVRIDVQTGGSSRGIADAKRGLADIGMSSRALKDDEKEGLASHTLALDGVCFLVHKENPVTELSNPQIVDIFTGKTTNWKAVGGKDAPITVINRADGRSELELFTHHFKLKANDIKASLIAGDNEQGIKTLAGNPDAIIFMSIGTSEQDSARGVPIKLLPLGGVKASVENVRNGTFPFSRPLVLLTGPSLKPTARQFLDYALSAGAQPVIQEFSFVPNK